jgi:hypothetical protein
MYFSLVPPNPVFNELTMVLQMGNDAGRRPSFPLAFQLLEALTPRRSPWQGKYDKLILQPARLEQAWQLCNERVSDCCGRKEKVRYNKYIIRDKLYYVGREVIFLGFLGELFCPLGMADQGGTMEAGDYFIMWKTQDAFEINDCTK